jgi:hypothetical protein
MLFLWQWLWLLFLGEKNVQKKLSFEFAAFVTGPIVLALCVFCSRIFTLHKSSVRCMDGGQTGLDEAFVFVLFQHRSFVVCSALLFFRKV